MFSYTSWRSLELTFFLAVFSSTSWDIPVFFDPFFAPRFSFAAHVSSYKVFGFILMGTATKLPKIANPICFLTHRGETASVPAVSADSRERKPRSFDAGEERDREFLGTWSGMKSGGMVVLLWAGARSARRQRSVTSALLHAKYPLSIPICGLWAAGRKKMKWPAI